MSDEVHLDLDFDAEALRARYARERDRRVRRDGRDQYVEAKGRFARYGEDDPYGDPTFARAPLDAEVEVVIIGGGFGGMAAAARLRESGVEDIKIIEAGSDFGGTWYWNRYPGAQCDVESYIYLPLLEETGFLPKEKYSFQPEIYAHAQRIANHFGLHELACFNTRVNRIRWDESIHRWRVKTDRGDALRARFVIVATGPANRPKLPGIPGLESFEGHAFHTARWDYAYTGGDTYGGLEKLADKRVAIIGTGATAIQVVPHLAESAKRLYVFQRTPSSVDLRGNKPTDPEWAKSLKPGWQRERQDNFNAVIGGEPFEVDLVDDMWTDARRYQSITAQQAPGASSIEDVMRLAEIADFRKMNGVRARVDQIVEHPAAAEALKPWYPRHCKRPCFHDEYLPSFNKPNVTLVDTSESLGVERITPKGMIANGVEYLVDCIIFATGFEITTGPQRALPFQIVGRNGETLVEHWTPVVRTLHGFTCHGFPNWFFLGSSQNGLSANYTSMLSEQARHIAYTIREARARGASTVEPTAAAEADWAETIHTLAAPLVELLASCTPGYYNNEGHIADGNGRGIGEIYTPGLNAFNALLEQWREAGSLAGLKLGFADAPPARPDNSAVESPDHSPVAAG